ncbi:MAG: hypothetical protein AAFY39_09415 [Pseudomonadota bacterium]
MSKQTNDITADLATQRGALNLRRLHLIAIIITPEQRGALLRTAGGQVRQIAVGDSLLSGTVIAIDEDRVILDTSSGQRVLRMPGNPAAAA